MKNFLKIFTLTLVSLILIGGQQLVVSGVAQAQTKASTTVCFDKKTGAVAASNDKKECADASFKVTTIDAYDNQACLTGTKPNFALISPTIDAKTKKVICSKGKLTTLTATATDKTTANPTAEAFREDGSAGFVPCGNTADNPCTIGHLFKAFVVIINYLIAMAGFVAVVAIVYAGFMMIYSQGEQKLADAKKRFTGAIIGIVLVAAAFIIINSLFTGKLSVGVCNGEFVLSDPIAYINSTCK